MSQSTGRSSRAVCERADGRRALSWTDVGIVLLGCAALTAMLFGSAFRESMMPDDPLSIATGRIANERGLAEAHAIFSDLWLRPIPLLHYALCYRLFGMAPDGYRLANALWHLLNTLLVLALAWRFTRSRGLSALAAGMFATHFGHWENAVWLSAVEDLHAGFFTLAALLAYGRFRQRGERTWYAIALAAAMGALLSKEVAVMVAPMLLAADLLAEPSTPAPWQRRLAQAAIRTLPFFAMSVLFASAVLFSGRVEMVAGAGKWDLFGAHVPRNALGYLGWMLWPYETAGELPGVAGSPAAGLFRAVFVVVRLAAAAGVVWLLLRGTPTQRLLVVWLLLAIAPYAFRTAMFSRYCYTMTAFFAVLVARIAHDSHHPNTQDPTPQHPNTPTPQHPNTRFSFVSRLPSSP